jgi:glycosyltransferase involved in cell wall biosynthesis
MRVVIACCGLEHTRRGYEAFSRELFGALSGHLDVTLCKGSGSRRPREVIVPCLRRDFLAHFMSPGRAFYWEQITFAFALIPYLFLRRVDLVHFSEGNMGNALARLVRWAGLRTRLLQSNGGPLHPRSFRPEVFIHQVMQDGLDQAIDWGIPPARMHLEPYGINPEKFRLSLQKEDAREKLGLPRDKFLILSLAALNRRHKRLDYLICEVAALQNQDVFLCMAGEPEAETEDLRELARQLLPGRHGFMTVPRARIPELLATADLFVHTALHEGFGMVLLEACAAGAPVACHNSPRFQWIMGDAALYTDMAAPGALTRNLSDFIVHEDRHRRLSDLGAARIESFFDWKVLAPRYIAMYEAVLAS